MATLQGGHTPHFGPLQDDQQLLWYQFQLPRLLPAIMDVIDDSHGFPEDALPPEGQFSSREELAAAINA